ncbi:kelch repeat-containing protein [Planctomycetota bacterium]
MFNRLMLIICCFAVLGIIFAPGTSYSRPGSAAKWQKLAAGCTPRFAHTGVWNSKDELMVIFAGEGNIDGKFEFYNDIWTFSPDDQKWEEIKIAGDKPPKRAYHGSTWDSAANCMWTFGGCGRNFAPKDDLWKFNFTAKTWEQVTWQGTGPPARNNPSMHYIESSKQIILYSGFIGFVPNNALQDLWIFDIAKKTWKSRKCQAPGRWQCASAFDQKRGLLMIQGGFDGDSVPKNNTWVYQVKKNKWIDAGVGPRVTDAHSAVWNSKSGTMLIYGGAKSKAKKGFADTWSFNPKNMRWTEFKTAGQGPGPRAYQSAVWNGPKKCMLIFGGTENQFNDPPHTTEVYILKTGK